MKKIIFSLIFVFLFAAVLPEARSETVTNTSSNSVLSFLFGNNEASSTKSKQVKKRKLKKVVRKVARVYRKGKSDRSKIKKSRKIQRQARRIINIF